MNPCKYLHILPIRLNTTPEHDFHVNARYEYLDVRSHTNEFYEVIISIQVILGICIEVQIRIRSMMVFLRFVF